MKQSHNRLISVARRALRVFVVLGSLGLMFGVGATVRASLSGPARLKVARSVDRPAPSLPPEWVWKARVHRFDGMFRGGGENGLMSPGAEARGREGP